MVEKKVLVIDDEEHCGSIIKTHLELEGEFKVWLAYDGPEGLKRAKRVRPDVIILDVNMPGMNGFEVLERLKSDPRTLSIPVVMLSGIEDDQWKIRSSRLYADCYLAKSTLMPQFKARLRELLKLRGVE